MSYPRITSDLGEIGVAGVGILRPLDLTLYRNGVVWDLTGYTIGTFTVWNYRTKAAVTPSGTLSIQTASSGIVRYEPGAHPNPIYQDSGLFEGRVSATPGGVGQPETSGVFRFSIGAAAAT